jgi:fucose 4-O-acetylase-like acetyltransferase
MIVNGERVKILHHSNNTISNESYIVLNCQRINDLLLPYSKYTLLNIITYEILCDIKVWDHCNGLQCQLLLENHTMYSYLLSICLVNFKYLYKHIIR